MIEVNRIHEAVNRHGVRLLRRVFTPRELQDCAGNPKSLAVRFAAKEAVSKAFGTGIGVVGFKEIEIVRLSSGAPELFLHGKAAKVAEELGLETWSISLSHSDQYAVAFVVMAGTGLNRVGG